MKKREIFSRRLVIEYGFILLLLFFSFIVIYVGINIFSLSGALFVQSSSTIAPSMIVVFDIFDVGGTNFSMIGTQDFGAVMNVSLVKGGSVLFFSGIMNMSADSDPSDGVTNLSKYVNMTSTSVSVDSVHLPNFNRSARITFSGLSFVSPRILLDGSLCSSSICSVESYSGGSLIFNVSHFTMYSVEEGVEGGGTMGTGGQVTGGGSSAVVSKSFTVMNVSKDAYVVKQGNSTRGEFIVRNDAPEPKTYSISSSLPGMIFFDESEVTILPGDSHTFSFMILAQEYASPTIYSAKIKVDDGVQSQEFSILIIVQERQPLFDVLVKTEDGVRDFNQEMGKIPINIFIQNMGDSYLLDVLLKIQITDMTGLLITEQIESVAIDKTLSLARGIPIPKNVPQGEYIIVVTATYEGKEAVGGILIRLYSEQLSHLETPLNIIEYGVKEWKFVVIVIVFFIFALLFFMVMIRQNVKKT